MYDNAPPQDLLAMTNTNTAVHVVRLLDDGSVYEVEMPNLQRIMQTTQPQPPNQHFEVFLVFRLSIILTTRNVAGRTKS